MKHFICLDGNLKFDLLLETMLKTLDKTVLDTICILDETSKCDSKLKILEKYEVPYIFHTLSFKNIISERSDKYRPDGAFLRLDLPFIINKHNIDVSDNYLYTDVDLLFTKNISNILKEHTNTLALSYDNNIPMKVRNVYDIKFELHNSGVILSNTQFMNNTYDDLLKFIYNIKKINGANDQPIINAFYVNDIELLNEIYNWKGTWKPNDDAAIIHFNKKKPYIYINKDLTNESNDYVYHLNLFKSIIKQ